MNIIEVIKQHLNKNTVLDFLRENGFHASQVTDQSTRGTCPLHGGDNPSAFVWTFQNNLWFCHTGCNTGGDIFDFVAQKFDLNPSTNFKQIVYKTAELLRIDISGFTFATEYNSRADIEEWLQYTAVTDNTMPPFDVNLLGQLEAIMDYGGYGQNIIDRYGLYRSPLLNRLVIPLHHKGVVVGVNLRTLIDETPKYMLLPKDLKARNILYGLNLIPPEETSVWVVEGCTDVWNLYLLGVPNVVATLGSHMSKEQEDLLLSRFINVIIAYDGDDAGRKAACQLIDRLNLKTNLAVIDLPDGADPGGLPGREDLSEVPPYEFQQKYKR